jgi:hypothetical protein
MSTAEDRRRAVLVLGALVLAALPFVVISAFQAVHDSPTFDEPVYIQAGLAAIAQHDLRLNDEHPPLAKVLAALPVLLAHPTLTPLTSNPAADEHRENAAFVRAQDRRRLLQRETELARIVPILEALVCGLVIFRLGSKLHGDVAGLVGAVLWWWNPLTLGVGHLDGIDVPFTLATLLVAWALVTHIDHRSRRSVVVLGLACGAALLTRHTGVIVVGGAIAGLLATRRRTVRDALLVGGIAFASIWAAYLVLDPRLNAHLGLLPSVYVDGVRHILDLGRQPGPGFLLGQRWVGARWWFWPVALAAKVPVTTLVASLLGVAGVVATAGPRRWTWVRALLLPMVALVLFTLTQARPVGVRYLLPAVGLLLMSAGATLRHGRRAVVGLAATGAFAFASMIGASAHALAWTPWPFHPGYRSLTDSSVDWGQDFDALDRWSAAHHPRVAYFGPRGRSGADLSAARPLLGVDRAIITGWVAASATLITGDPADHLGWLRGYCPVGSINGSVLLYFFRSPPVETSFHGRPPTYCATGATSS